MGLRKTIFALSLVAFAALSGCSTKVDLYADYKQVPVIYGLLDAKADTNYIKITRAFYPQGDAYQVALNPDSSNYPGRLDVRLVEYRNNDSIGELILDTITIHNKETGTFYAPEQKLYYTAEKLKTNTSKSSYSYRLKVALPDRNLSTKAKMVGCSSFGVQSLGVNFSKQYIGKPPLPFLFHPAINAKFYQVSMAFTFLEQRTPDSDSVPRTMAWDIGTWMDYELSDGQEDSYVFRYSPSIFYEKLAEFIGADTSIVGMKRFITDYPVEVTISAGGENLRHYIYTNNDAYGFVGNETEFSLIDGARGVFSSRSTTRARVRLAGETVPDLVSITKYRFVFIGGKDATDE